MTTPSSCQLIGMLHVPVNTILAAPSPWRESLGLPESNAEDWKIIKQLEDIFSVWPQTCHFDELEEAVTSLSFYSFLKDQVLKEARLYLSACADALMLENVAAPYFVRSNQPAVIVAIMSSLAKGLKSQFPNKKFGLQILAFSDDLALAIALRHKLDFVRSETGLYGGLRPEGETPNSGNLAQLYALRNEWRANHPAGNDLPEIYVDLRKKHTIFPAGLQTIDKWVENLHFQKTEGAVLTGPHTGTAVNQDELAQLREGIESIYDLYSWKPKLLIGSGVTLDNLGSCRAFADALIVGSYFKKNGHWENPLDEERLKRFSEVWHKDK